MKRRDKIYWKNLFGLLLLFNVVLFIFYLSTKPERKTKLEELQTKQGKYYEQNKKVMICNQYFTKFKTQGFISNLFESKEYLLDSTAFENDGYYAYFSDNNGKYRISFESFQIPQELFPEEDYFIEIDSTGINNEISIGGDRITDVFVTPNKYYPSIKIDSVQILFLDDKGNQITLLKKLIKTKKI
jgi:hypothetical protein